MMNCREREMNGFVKGSWKIVLSALLLAASILPGQGAFAGPVPPKTIDLGSLTSPATVFFGDNFTSPNAGFLDHFVFSLSLDSVFTSLTVTQSFAPLLGIDFLQASLWFQGGPLIAYGGFGSSGPVSYSYIVDTPLSAGAYDLQVYGWVTGTAGGSFAGTMSMVPVPEPGTYAMMLAGLGLMGFIVRRRKQ